jgi:hypothetical protein
MIRSLLRVIGRILASRLGLWLFAANVLFLAVGIFQRGGLGGAVHPTYEPALLQIIVLLNFPSLLAAGVSYEFLTGFPGDLTEGWLGGLLVLSAAYSQWCLVGYCVERWVQVSRELDHPVR